MHWYTKLDALFLFLAGIGFLIRLAATALLKLTNKAKETMTARIIRWLNSQLPIQCPLCKRWTRDKNTRKALHRTAGWIKVCQACYKDLYPGG
jgi:hypothetical protein